VIISQHNIGYGIGERDAGFRLSSVFTQNRQPVESIVNELELFAL